MHTNWCVLVEISLEIGMLNFLVILLVTALKPVLDFIGCSLPHGSFTNSSMYFYIWCAIRPRFKQSHYREVPRWGMSMKKIKCYFLNSICFWYMKTCHMYQKHFWGILWFHSTVHRGAFCQFPFRWAKCHN